MRAWLDHLLAESRRLPPLHVLASFFAAALVGLVAIALIGRAGPSPHAAGPTPTDGQPRPRQQKSTSLDVGETIGQLTVVPVNMSRSADFDAARRLVGSGAAGGVLLVVSDPNDPPDSRAVRQRVRELQAVTGADRPELLVIAAMEGVSSDAGYCASVYDGARDDLRAAIDGNTRQLVARLRSLGANALLGVSFKDEAAGCFGGADADPAAFARDLQRRGIALIARGARFRDFERYAAAYDAGLRMVTASVAPRRGTPTWRNPGAIRAMHARARKLVIGTPDLSAIRGGSLDANIATALRSGVDLPLYAAGSGVDAIRSWFSGHRGRLRLSCMRIVELKQTILHSSVGPAACLKGGG